MTQLVNAKSTNKEKSQTVHYQNGRPGWKIRSACKQARTNKAEEQEVGSIYDHEILPRDKEDPGRTRNNKAAKKQP